MNVNGASRLDGGAVFRFMPMLAKAGRTSTPGRSAFATVALLWLIGLGEERRGREHRDVGHPEPAPVNGKGERDESSTSRMQGCGGAAHRAGAQGTRPAVAGGARAGRRGLRRDAGGGG